MRYRFHVPKPKEPKTPPALGRRLGSPEKEPPWYEVDPDGALYRGMAVQVKFMHQMRAIRASEYDCPGACGRRIGSPLTKCYHCTKADRERNGPSEFPPLSETHTTQAKDDAKRAAIVRAARR